MRKIGVFLIVPLLLFGCKQEEVQSPDPKLFMTFNPRANGEDLLLGQSQTNQMDYSYSVSEMKMFLSDIELIGQNGKPISLSEIEIIDIARNKRTLEFTIPNGVYQGVRYNLGVPKQMNGVNDPEFSPSQYPIGHPLNEQTTQMYWQLNAGYKFFTLEGRYSTDPADAEPSRSFVFHTGHDTLFRTIGFFEKTFDLSKGGNALLNFSIEMDSIFISGQDTLDLAVFNSFHGSLEQLDHAEKLVDRMVRAFVLE